MSSIPIQIQLFDAFLGQNEAIHSVLLPNVFSSGGSKNMYLDKMGRATIIDGYVKQNTTVLVSKTLSDPVQIAGLATHRTNTAGVFTRILLTVTDDRHNQVEIKKSADDGVTWIGLTDLGPLAVGRIPDFVQFGDVTFIPTGMGTPKAFDGTTITTAGATQSPTPVVAESSKSGVLSGIYRYKLVSREADGNRSPGSVASTNISTLTHQVELSWTQDSNTDVVGYEVYRTTGTGSIYYFVAYVAGINTLSYTDNISDDTIFSARALDEHGEPPPDVHFAVSHKGRMWWLRTDDAPTTGWWSDPNDPDSLNVAFNYLLFEESETQGDMITGGIGDFGDQLLIFTENTIWSVNGTGMLINGFIRDWNKERKNVQTGTVSKRSIVRVPIGAKYQNALGDTEQTQSRSVAYLTPQNDIRLFDGQSDTIISLPLRDTLARINPRARHKAHCLHDLARGQFVWFVPVDGSEECNRAVAWNYLWGVWYEWDAGSFASSTVHEDANHRRLLLVGEASPTVGGYIYRFFEGPTFNGTEFTGTWMTKPLRGVVNIKDDLTEALSYDKRFRWVDLTLRADSSSMSTGVSPAVHQWTLSWHTEDESDTPATTTVVPYDFVTLSSDPCEILTTNAGASGPTTILPVDWLSTSQVLHISTPLEHRKISFKKGDHDYHTGPAIRLRLSASRGRGSWSLEGMSLAYQVLGGDKRRLQFSPAVNLGPFVNL